MFYSFYLFLSILLCNVDNALVPDSNSYIWVSHCIQMFELYSNVRIYIKMLKDFVFSPCPWKMASSDDVGKHMKEERDFFTSTPILFKFKNFAFYWEGGEHLCWAWRNAREFSWQSVMVVVGGSKNEILAWRSYWIALIPEQTFTRTPFDGCIITFHSISELKILR